VERVAFSRFICPLSAFLGRALEIFKQIYQKLDLQTIETPMLNQSFQELGSA